MPDKITDYASFTLVHELSHDGSQPHSIIENKRNRRGKKGNKWEEKKEEDKKTKKEEEKEGGEERKKERKLSTSPEITTYGVWRE